MRVPKRCLEWEYNDLLRLLCFKERLTAKIAFNQLRLIKFPYLVLNVKVWLWREVDKIWFERNFRLSQHESIVYSAFHACFSRFSTTSVYWCKNMCLIAQYVNKIMFDCIWYSAYIYDNFIILCSKLRSFSPAHFILTSYLFSEHKWQNKFPNKEESLKRDVDIGMKHMQ